MKKAKENLVEKSLSQKLHPVRQKLLSVLLCVCLLLVSQPLEFYGSKVQAEEPQKKALSFSELPGEVKYQTVEPGTPLEDLNLPKTLEAVCVPAGQESNVNRESLAQPAESQDVKGTAPENGYSAVETQEVSEDTDDVKLPEETQEPSDKNNNETEIPAENHTEEPGESLEATQEEQPETPTPDSEPGTGSNPGNESGGRTKDKYRLRRNSCNRTCHLGSNPCI